MKQFAKLFIATALTAVLSVFSAAQAWGEDTTVSYGWENSDDASAWTITDAIVKTSGQGNTGTYAGKINSNHTYVQFNSKVYVISFSFAFKRTSNNTNYNVYIETSTDGTNWTAAETYTMGSFNNGSYTTKTKTFDGKTEYYVRFHCYNTTATRYVDDVTITYTEGSGTPTCATPTFSPAAGTYTSAQNVTISTTTEDATIYYTTNGTEPTTSSSVYSTAIPVSATTTIKAIAAKEGSNNSSVASATYTIVNIEHAGTEADPYTVADALAAIDANVGITNVYVSGIVSTGGFNFNSGALSYKISDDGTTSNELQVYRGKGINGANFASADDIQLKDEVVVKGNLTKYNNTTYQFAADNQLVSLDRPVIPFVTLSTYSVDSTSAEKEGTIDVTYNNLTNIQSEVVFVEDDGETLATYNWLVAEIKDTDNTKLNYLISENAGTEARTAYLKVYALGDEGDAYSNLVTVSQAGYVVDYATLPFSFDSGRSSIASTTGLTQSGLGSDYASSPQLKFDDAGDFVVLKINDRPGTLSYNIKGNSFSNGLFKVQASCDGENYSDLKSYTSLGDATTETINDLDESVRYVRWIYVSKTSGNVALGKLSLTEGVASIILNSTAINANDGETEGALDVAYRYVETSAGVEIHWFESDGETKTSKPIWLSANISDNKVYYVIDENLGSARTAYFKVYGIDSEANDVYSKLVTVSQSAYSAASLPFLFKGGSSDIATTDGLTQSGLGSDYTTSDTPPLKFDDEGDYVLLHILGAPAVLSFDIKGNSFSGGTFKVQISSNGKSFDDLKVYTALGSKTSQEFSIPSNVRFIKWVYTRKVSGNVGLGNISVTALDPTSSTITLGASLNNGRYWATFFNGSARYVLPEGAKAYTMDSNNQLYRLGDDGSVVPAGTAVVVIADSASITLTKSDDDSEVNINGSTNILQGSNSPVEVSGLSGTPYVLGIKNGKVGFYHYKGSSIPAIKAYYVVND